MDEMQKCSNNESSTKSERKVDSVGENDAVCREKVSGRQRIKCTVFGTC